jgi:hypothetical protein
VYSRGFYYLITFERLGLMMLDEAMNITEEMKKREISNNE